MTSTRMHRDGAWTVELQTAIQVEGSEKVDEITLIPPTFQQVFDWSKSDGGNFALVAIISGTSEELLGQLVQYDLDRVLVALTYVAPPAVRELLGKRPLFTPPPKPEQEYIGPAAMPMTTDEPLPEPPPEMLPHGVVAAHDPGDPRFPLLDPTIPRETLEPVFTDQDLGTAGPAVAKTVGEKTKPIFPPRSPTAPKPALEVT